MLTNFLNKRDDLLLHIAGNEPDIIMITEVLPKVQPSFISDVQLYIPGYNLFTNFKLNCDLTGAKGRGIVIYLSCDLTAAHQVYFTTTNFEEQIWITVPLKGHDTLLVGCIYRSPSDETLSSTISLCNLLSSICNYTHLLICGDFNYPNINWVNMSSGSPASQLFLQTIQDHYLYQHVQNPTRYRDNSTPHVLDLIFSNQKDFVEDIQYLPGLGLSDHVCLEFGFKCYSLYNPVSIPKFNLRSADFPKMRQLISDVDWESILNPLDLQDAWHYFSTVFDDIIAKSIPLDLPHHKKNIYMSHKAFRLKNKKCKLWNRYTATRSVSIYNLYCKTRNELRNLTWNLHCTYEKRLVSNCNENPRKYVNSRLMSRSVIDILKKTDNSIAYTDKDKSKLLNDFFTSVFTHKDTNSMPSLSLDREAPILSSIKVTPSIIYSKLKDIKSDKSPGPEGWPPSALKEAAEELSLPLYILFMNRNHSSPHQCLRYGNRHLLPLFIKKASAARQKIIVQIVLHQQLGRYLNP